MCLDYHKVEISNIIKVIDNYFYKKSKEKFKVDPLLENHEDVSKTKTILNSLFIKHGTWIEDSLTDWIRAIPNWEADCRLNIKIAGVTKQIDNIAFNKKTKKLIIFECKRIWENQDSTKQLSVTENLDIYKKNEDEIIKILEKKIKFKPNKIEMIIFNAWGTSKKFKNSKSTKHKVICRDEIGKIFGKCLWIFIIYHKDYVVSLFERFSDLPATKDLDNNPIYQYKINMHKDR